MKSRTVLLGVAVLVALGVLPGFAWADVLTFDAPTDGEQLFALSSYDGDFAHVTFSGGGFTSFGSSGTPLGSPFDTQLSWANTGFGGGKVTGVLWLNDSTSGYVASITLTANPGYLVKINSFDLGLSDSASQAGLNLIMYSDAFKAVPFFTKTVVAFPNDMMSVVPEYGQDDQDGFSQITLQWKDAYRIAMDNVSFSVVKVIPEPTTLALYGLGLAGLGLVAARRRTAG